eukprot:5455188-Pyramimonas_sp.AAC.1
MTEVANAKAEVAEDGGSDRPGGSEGLATPVAPPLPQSAADPSSEESPAPEGGDAAARIVRSIREVSNIHFEDNRARQALERERDWFNGWRSATFKGQSTVVDPYGLEEMEIDIVFAQYKYVLAEKRGLHEPG